MQIPVEFLFREACAEHLLKICWSKYTFFWREERRTH